MQGGTLIAAKNFGRTQVGYCQPFENRWKHPSSRKEVEHVNGVMKECRDALIVVLVTVAATLVVIFSLVRTLAALLPR